MANIVGTVSVSSDLDDWIVLAYDADTNALAGSSLVQAGTYAVTGLTAGRAYMLMCRPVTGSVWTASDIIKTGACTVPADPITTPYVYQSSGPGSSHCRFLCQFDGTDNGTTFTDDSPSPLTPTTNYNTVTKTGVKQFGTASAYFNGTSLLRYSNESKLGLGTGDFTIEFWARPLSSSDYQVFFNLIGSTNQYIFLSLNNNANYQPILWNGFLAIASARNLTQNVFSHLALTSENDMVRMYVDGYFAGQYANAYDLGSSGTLTLGANGGNTQTFAGYLDSLRIVAGKALYTGTATFTPPTAALTTVSQLGSGEPTWPTVVDQTVVDGDITWTCKGRMVQPIVHGPLVAA